MRPSGIVGRGCTGWTHTTPDATGRPPASATHATALPDRSRARSHRRYGASAGARASSGNVPMSRHMRRRCSTRRGTSSSVARRRRGGMRGTRRRAA